MSYNKKSSYEMPIENKVRAQARIDEITKRQKSDFDKAVAAEVGIALRTLLNDATLSLYDYQREALGHLIEKKESGATPLINYRKEPELVQHIGQPCSRFTMLSSELMAKITDLGMVVDNLVDQLKPFVVACPPPAGEPAKSIPLQVQSEFVEFVECAGRRVDALREKIADTMSRLTI